MLATKLSIALKSVMVVRWIDHSRYAIIRHPPGTAAYHLSQVSYHELHGLEWTSAFPSLPAYEILLSVQGLSPATKTQAAFAPVVHALLTPLGVATQG